MLTCRVALDPSVHRADREQVATEVTDVWRLTPLVVGDGALRRVRGGDSRREHLLLRPAHRRARRWDAYLPLYALRCPHPLVTEGLAVDRRGGPQHRRERFDRRDQLGGARRLTLELSGAQQHRAAPRCARPENGDPHGLIERGRWPRSGVCDRRGCSWCTDQPPARALRGCGAQRVPRRRIDPRDRLVCCRNRGERRAHAKRSAGDAGSSPIPANPRGAARVARRQAAPRVRLRGPSR